MFKQKRPHVAMRRWLVWLAVLALALAACAAPAAPAQTGSTGSAETGAAEQEAAAPAAEGQTVLRIGWWGNEPRHNMYNELLDLYEDQNPDIVIEREFAGWDAYWEKLATQVAGGNAPDIIHMHPNYLFDYGTRGALLDLTPLVESGQIDLSTWEKGIVDTGRIDGKIYMLTLGNSAPGIHYNPALFEQAGVPLPATEWTWSEWQETAIALAEALGPDVYAMSDSGSDHRGMRIFLNQQGKSFFEGEGLGFTPEDLTAYWQMWENLRAAGALPPAALSVEYATAGHADSMLVQGVVVMQLQSGNQHKLYQAHLDNQLGLAIVPASDDPSASLGYIVDGAYISLSANTEHVEESAAFLNWFLNDPDVALRYNAEHGPIGNQENNALVREQMEPADQRLSEMMDLIVPESVPQGPQPAGGGEVLSAYDRIYGELAFGNLTLEEAVNAFFEEVDFILGG